MLWTGLRLNISPWFMSLISPEMILFSRGGDSPCVCFSPSSTSRRESWSEKCYHQEQVYLLHLEEAIPESRIQSPSISWTPLPVNHFPAASGPLCYRRTLIRSSIKTWTWTRSSWKECSKWEGRRWCNTLKGIISVKIVDFSFFFFLLDFDWQQHFREESTPCTASWLDVRLWESHKILGSSKASPEAELLLPMTQSDIWVVKSAGAQSCHLT